MDAGNEHALDSYLCTDLTQKVKSKKRKRKELNVCVEYLNSKGRSAPTSAYVYKHIYIYVHGYKKKENRSLTEKLREKYLWKVGSRQKIK